MIVNPILKGFCPDPSIIRAGGDYYIATSTFEWWPGVRLWKSSDLEHWTQIPSPINRKSQLDMTGNPNNCGVWAPCLSYSDRLFYLVYTDVKTQKRPYYNSHNYLIWSDNINGPWSEPVYLNSTGFDPSLFHDDDGRKYLINMRNGFKGILLQEYDAISRKLIGETHLIFSGTQTGLTEGPHLYKKNGWYYLFTAEGGTGYEHRETVARSRSILGPYEVYYKPLITSVNHPENSLQKCGHGQIVETPSGDSYFVHLCSRPIDIKVDDLANKAVSVKRSMLGRETAIQKLKWTDDGWPELDSPDGLPSLQVESPRDISTLSAKKSESCLKKGEFGTNSNSTCETELVRDDFDSDELNVAYTFLRHYPENKISLSQRPGFLRLYGQESITSMHNVSLVARRQTEYFCTAETCMEFSPICPEQAAGICYIYNNENFYLFFMAAEDTGEKYLSFLKINKAVYKNADPAALGKINVKFNQISKSEKAVKKEFPGSCRIYLRAVVRQEIGQFYYSYDGNTWEKAFNVFDASLLSDEYACGFTGAHFAIYCHDMTGANQYSDFDYFSLKNDQCKNY